MDEAGAQNILSVMWVSIIAGRLLCSYISRIIYKEKLILICTICGFVFITIFMVIRNPALIALMSFSVNREAKRRVS
jgi:fucose permease